MDKQRARSRLDTMAANIGIRHVSSEDACRQWETDREKILEAWSAVPDDAKLKDRLGECGRILDGCRCKELRELNEKVLLNTLEPDRYVLGIGRL